MTQAPTLDWPEGLRPAETVHAFALADGLVLWNEATDEVHHLNATASLVWAAIAEGRPLEDLGRQYGDAHPDGAEGIHRDVEVVVTTFATDGLVLAPGAEPPEPAAPVTDGLVLAPGAQPPPAAPLEAADEPAPRRRGHATGLGKAIEAGMADRPWSDPLGPYSLAGYRFEIVAEDATLLPTLTHAFSGLAVDHDGSPPERVWVRTRRNERVPYSIIHGDRRGGLAQDVTGVILETLRDLSRHVFGTAPFLVLHAAAVADERGAIVIVGRSGAGKSTTCAALVEQGFRYLADETVVIDPATLEVVPVLRPLKLEVAGRDALDAYLDGAIPRLEPVNDARTIRVPTAGVATNERAPIRTIVFSEFRRDGFDEVASMSAADALSGLLEHRYGSGLDAPDQIDTIIRLATDAAAWSLIRADLAKAVDLVRDIHCADQPAQQRRQRAR